MSESNLFHPIEGVKSYAKQHPIKAGVWGAGLVGTVWLANTISLGCNVIGDNNSPDSVQAVDCQVDKQGTVEVDDTLKKITVRIATGKLGEISLGYFAANKDGKVAMTIDQKATPIPLAKEGTKIHTEHGTVKVKEVPHFGDPAVAVHCPPHNS
jgi:hypothetical protein